MKKIKKVFSINLLAGLLMIFFASTIKAQELPVKITGIRSSKGKIIISIFKDEAAYEEQLPYRKITFDKNSIDNGTMTVKLTLEPGIYGITLLDDENGNGKIDKNIISVPKEGFGFSNFFMEKMKKPSFDNFKVDLKTKSNIDIRVKYM
ncbi:DUF2141 domain-containing protein [Mucilaginibacter gynuensis]|uniref:DUF2141 domain-containing protein n=1 Tax=Mucilaginibacter gynuensis TaxID=1302236 RepID=A0ABP8GN20_9SPHI